MGWAREHIRTSLNKIDKNRSILTSNKRTKFKEDNAESPFFDDNQSNKLTFKEVSDSELGIIKDNIYKKNKAENKKEKIVLFVSSLIVLGLIVFAIIVLNWK